jgi:DNA-binding NtrC family response regulator
MGPRPRDTEPPEFSETDPMSTAGDLVRAAADRRGLPALALAWRPADVPAADRMRLRGRVQVGRAPNASWPIADRRLSSAHFEVLIGGGKAAIRDLGSRNGTFVNGVRLGSPRPLLDQDVIRAGRCVFVYVADAATMTLEVGVADGAHGMAGPFHSPVLLVQVAEAVRTGRHLLLEGETGVGKELVARAVHRIGHAGQPFVAHNCAAFASSEDAETALFGVVRGAFTGVEPRAGLLERAHGGVLYLDELPNLPLRVQRSLLRFAEDGEFARIGDATRRRAQVRLLLGTNRAVANAVAGGVLAHDLVARTHRLFIPPLSRRRADVPSIFVAALTLEALRAGLDPESCAAALNADAVEALTLGDCEGHNVRFLQDLASAVCVRLALTPVDDWSRMAAGVFLERFFGSPVLARYARATEAAEPPARVSPYEANREAILQAYGECGGSLSAMEAALRERGLSVHRRWLAEFLDRWGVRKRRGRRRPTGPA